MISLSNQQLIAIEKAITLSEHDRETMKQDMNELKNAMNAFRLEFKQFTESLDNRYAKKSSVDKLWTIVWSVIAFFFTGAGGVVISLIFIKP